MLLRARRYAHFIVVVWCGHLAKSVGLACFVRPLVLDPKCHSRYRYTRFVRTTLFNHKTCTPSSAQPSSAQLACSSAAHRSTLLGLEMERVTITAVSTTAVFLGTRSSSPEFVCSLLHFCSRICFCYVSLFSLASFYLMLLFAGCLVCWLEPYLNVES